jgi:hypothetical protein
MPVTIRESPEISNGDRMSETKRKRRLTRKELAAFLRDEHGYPVGDSTINKLCAPTVNEGPPVVGWWGNRPLYDPDEGVAWAEARLKAVRRANSAPVGPAPPDQHQK